MKKSKSIQILLIISGLIGIGIGGALLFAPVAFQASAGIDLGENISLLSEIRAPGGLLVAGGLIIILGAFMSKWTDTALALSSLLYLSYGVSRILSLVIDGIPHSSLLYATTIELIIGFLSLFLFIKYKKTTLDTILE